MSAEFDQILPIFIQESRELLAEMESSLLTLESNPDDPDLINAVFRAAHTIKGTAGLFGLTRIVGFTHVVEELLDQVRNGRAISGELTALLLESADVLAEMIDGVELAGEAPEAPAEAPLLARLKAQLTPSVVVAPVAAPVAPVPAPLAVNAGNAWRIQAFFGPECYRNALDPAPFIQYLATLGQIRRVTTLSDGLPPLESFDPETCYLGFEIDLDSDASQQTIEATFDFVRDESRVTVSRRAAEAPAIMAEPGDGESLLGKILVESGALSPQDLDQGLRLQNAATGSEAKRLGTILVEEHLVEPPVLEAALVKQTEIRGAKERENRSIRVDADKLDNLINLVGELVIASAGTAILAVQSGASQLVESASLLSRLVEEVRESAMRLRLVQIGGTFTRFQRVVRDLSRDLAKDIRLEITGGETELDKSVVEKIGDPLTHLVRNSIDHGIEHPAERVAAGKSANGTVRLHAYHDSGSVVIEVSDDGKGLDAQRILAKAQQRGLVAAGANPSESELYQLIFEPGFSTAESVSNVSGRGVGMDVVRRNIAALRGQIELDSQKGHGTTVRIRLPLTLAIIDGFLVRVGAATYVIPLETVRECIDLQFDQEAGVYGRDYVNLRGEVLPLMRLREWFSLESAVSRRNSIVVVQAGSQKAGLVVDELLGEFQTVIKPLGSVFGNIKGVCGATILGSGAIALILDVPVLLRQAVEKEAAAEARLSVR